MSLKQRLVKGGFWVASSKLLTILSALLINMLLARLLNPDDLGMYFVLTSIVNALSILGLMGMNRLVVRLIAEKLSTGPDKIRSILVKAASMSGIGLLIIAAMYWAVLHDWFGKTMLELGENGARNYIVVWIVLWGCQAFVGEALRGFHDIRGASIFGLLLFNILLLAGLSGVWLTSNSLDLQSVLIIIVGALLITVMGGLYALKLNFKSLPTDVIAASSPEGSNTTQSIAKPSLYLLLTSMSLLLVNDIHLWLLSYLESESEVAKYGSALRLVNLLIFPLFVINQLIPSSVADLYVRNKKDKLQLLMYAGVIAAGIPSITALIISLVYGDILLEVVFGEQFMAAASCLSVMVLGHVMNAWSGSPGILLMMAGHERQILIFSLSSALFGITASVLLIPDYGAVGAAAGTAVTVVIHNMSMWLYARIRLVIDTSFSWKAIISLYHHLRFTVEYSVNDKSVLGSLERYWRRVEHIIWTARGYRIIECFGDSHARIFRCLNAMNAIKDTRFRVVAVRGATMFGLGNPNSRTNALNIFMTQIARVPSANTIVFMLGEVDMGYLIWWRAKKYGIDPSSAYKEAIGNYQDFLDTVLSTRRNMIVVSAPLPTIPDGHTAGDVAAARKEISASQAERTEATLSFNKDMQLWCEQRGIHYLSLDDMSLDEKTGLVRNDLLNENMSDHHYNQKTFCDVLVKGFSCAGLP